MRGERDRVTTQVDLAESQVWILQQGRIKEMKCRPQQLCRVRPKHTRTRGQDY